MSNLLFYQNKIATLVNLLQKGVEQNKQYNLTIVSCYFNPESIKRLIHEINNQNIQIVSVDIYVDIGDVLKIGKEELLKWLVGVKEKINTQFYVFNKCYLFHPKAYCLSVHKSFSIGNLVLGSANITGNGLTFERGNLELLIGTQTPDAIRKFFIDLSNLKSDFTQIESLEDFDSIFEQHINEKNYYLFEYYLLRCGYLVHQWDEKLSFTVSYKLIDQNKNTDNKEQQEIKDILGENEREFKVTKAIKSLTISYFTKDLDIINERYNLNKKIRRDIRGNYGIETILGHWIPKQIVDCLKKQQKQDHFEKFQNDLAMLNEKLDPESDMVEKHLENLKNAGKINQDKPNPKESFKINFTNTIKDSILLERIYYRYAITELPYLIEQDKEIKRMYQSLIQTCDCEKKRERCQKNKTIKAVMKAVCEAHSTKNLNPILNLEVK